ncbi:anti-sigma factor family protein [Gandjariella thermophila]|uniref:Anti-sigma-L factor RslA n=1 Tax=Gandjariella thermophila TaxID=1931992 RepID=A0A4D4JF73_9PSEU|nr:zf-HC2 domain-containing protein [Gandjariella thermophila]GDY32557.1 anti-sigma-L factor RslA [Gandjariella thermophila]
MTCQHTISLGAYVLGALDPGDRVELEQHLSACPTCRDELVRFAPIPGLLSHLTEEDLVEAEVGVTRRYQAPAPAQWSPPPDGPPPLPGPREGGSIGPPGRPDTGGPPKLRSRRLAKKLRRRTRQRFVLGAVGVLVAGIIAAGGVLGEKLLDKPTQPAAAAVTWTATDPATGVKANAQLAAQRWGTEVQLHMDNLPANQRCQLVVHGKDGTTESSAWWRNDYPGSETVPAASSMQMDRIQYMDVVNSSNNVLVRLEPH